MLTSENMCVLIVEIMTAPVELRPSSIQPAVIGKSPASGFMHPWQGWSQGAGKIPVYPTGFPAFCWKQLLSQFPQVNRKVKLALPCIGMDALGHGLQEMEWDFTEIVYAYDTDGALIPALLHLHGPEQMSKFNIGSEHGDLLQIDVTSWSRVDFVISLSLIHI